MLCAECGYVARREAQFYATRRRYGLAVVSILGCVAIVLFINDRIIQGGWPTLLPDRLLIWLLPIAPPSSGGVYGEIVSRAGRNDLSDGDRVALLNRCASGDWHSEPVTDKWIGKYGNFIADWRRSFVDDQKLEALLLPIPPRLDAATRDTWPEGMPVAINVQLRDWWPWGMECRIRATPRIPGPGADGSTPTTTFYRTGDDRYLRSAYALYLPPLDPNVKEIAIDFEIDRRRMANHNRGRGGSRALDSDRPVIENDWIPAGKQTITLKTRAQGTLEQIASPASDPALDHAVGQVFRMGAVKWAAGASPVRFYINPALTHAPPFDDVAVGVMAELLCDGTVARRLNLWWLGGARGGPSRRNYGFEIAYEDQQLLQSANAEDGLWTMRIRGDPHLALRAGTAARYWSGEVTLPLRLQLNPDRTAPPRAWWTEETGQAPSDQ
jgi:hypothetical protein